MESDFKEEYSAVLNEATWKTIRQEFISIGWKMRYVILMAPRHRQQSINYLKKWDLWGPLIICLLLALPMAIVSNNPNYEDSFINVFLVFWLGAALNSVNCRLLGSKGSLLRCLSTIGYCLLPLASFGLFTTLLHSLLPITVKLLFIIFGLFWSIISCLLIMRDLVSEERKWLCAYPILLFYIFVAWFSIIA